jgi:hypothetical protein
MASLAHYALPGIIVLASLGAFLMCLAVIRYGFAPLEEDSDEAARRLFLTRLAHAAAAVCFAGTALLAIAAWSARGAPAVAARRTDADTLGEIQGLVGEQAREITRLTEALHRLQLEVEERLAASESRPRSREAAPPAADRGPSAVERSPAGARPSQAAVERSPAGPPGGLPASERGQPTAQSRRATGEIRKPAPASRPEPAEGEQAYTLPAGAAARMVTATVEGVRVQVEMHPLKEHETAYVVRLTGAGRRPITGAEVSIQGRTADGRPVQTTLAPADEPGVHRGRLPNIAQDLRLRVAGPGTRFEVSLAGDTRW